MLAAIEREFEGEPFVAVGVHSPKFPNENDPEMVREAVRRYGITHPVVVDAGMRIWSEWGVSAWPTLVLIDAEGKIGGASAGEPDREALRTAVRRLVDDAKSRGIAAAGRLPIRPEPAPPGSLSYPGKVLSTDSGIFVADTGHDQVVVCDAEGTELARIGSGEGGHADGPIAEARLHHPHGMALVGETLYVADTGTHTLRAADLEARTVRTVAGTGSLGRGAVPGRAGPGVPLRSPWDLAWDGTRLYVAMAGAHQIWAYDPVAERIGPFAGTGREIHRDGPAETACFAQPSGLTLLDGALYVADSEISTIRVIRDLGGRPEVGTVCGSRDLFGFGDRDGVGGEVLLQHPIGIAAGDAVLYVADTYNHKVKRVDPATGECRTLFGNGEAERLPELVPGYDLAPAGPDVPCLFEPEGLAVRDGTLLVADTNNHRVLAIDLATGVRRALLGG